MMPLGENYFHFGLRTHSIIDLAALARRARGLLARPLGEKLDLRGWRNIFFALRLSGG